MRSGLAAVILGLCFAISVAAQPTPRATPVADGRGFETLELPSRLMDRKMPFQVIVPPDYSEKQSAGRAYPVVYLLHGLTGRYDNWTRLTEIRSYAARYDLIVVTPEGGNGWYSDNLTVAGDKYESYIVKELVPEIDRRYRTVAGRHGRSIAGLSMGGYGAVKFGLKYPEMFAIVGSFSGALSAGSITQKEIPGSIGKTIDAIFGPAGSEVRKANDLFEIIRGASADKIKAFPFIYMDCGTEDFLFPSNRDFVELLIEKRVPHEFRQLPGGHNWKYWNAQVEEFLEVAANHLKIGTRK